MSQELTDEQKLLRENIENLASKFPDRYWTEKDSKHEYPEEFIRELAKGGYMGARINQSHGGLGLGVLESSIIVEALARQGGLDAAGSAHAVWFNSEIIEKFGSEEMKKTFLPKIASGELRLQTLVITEPHSGFDTSKIKTYAKKEGDHYIVNGQKTFISRVQHTDLAILVARTTPIEQVQKKFQGISLFLIDIKNAKDSIKWQRLDLMCRRAVDTNVVWIEDLVVPENNLIGKEGNGFYHLLPLLNAERIHIAAERIGLGRAALSRAVEYSKTRIIFDRPIGQNQAIAFPLAEAHIKLEAADLMRFTAARKHDSVCVNQPRCQCGPEANMAKFLAAEGCFFAADRALQTFGGYGFDESLGIERFFREARLGLVTPVSQEMVLSFISNNVLDLPKSY